MEMAVTLPEALTEMPVKAFLMQQGISRTLWKRIKHSGTFRLNGKPAIAARTLVKSGDLLSWETEKISAIEPEALPLSIIYEDSALLIADKPAGQLVHPTTKVAKGTLGNAVLAHFLANGEQHTYHPVHRLDKDTSGLVLIAKLPQVQYLLANRKGSKKFQRDYLAICEGTPSPQTGSITAPIARALPSIILRKVAEDGQRACTHYETIESRNGLSLIRLRLETGRTHQIRVHMSHIGCPLAGDELYGGQRERIGRQALHAYRLQFLHPLTREAINVTAPLPQDMKNLLQQEEFSKFPF